MKFDPATGIIELTPGLNIGPGMTRKDLLAMNVKWEDWTEVDGVPRAMRALINLLNKGINPKTILIVHVDIANKPIAFWDIAPWDLTGCTQNRPEGKCTKRMRAWFKAMSGIALPLGRGWGRIDASYDPWNQSSGVVCNYRERFATDEQWFEFRRNNEF